jgi:hypothetical protein
MRWIKKILKADMKEWCLKNEIFRNGKTKGGGEIMFIRKIDAPEAINSNQIERLYVRKDVVEDADGKEKTQFAVVAEIYLKPTEGSEAHYHSERLSSHATLEAAQEEFDDLVDVLND